MLIWVVVASTKKRFVPSVVITAKEPEASNCVRVPKVLLEVSNETYCEPEGMPLIHILEPNATAWLLVKDEPVRIPVPPACVNVDDHDEPAFVVYCNLASPPELLVPKMTPTNVES